MTLSIIGFALLLGLIITLEIKSRKRGGKDHIRTENLIKDSCNDYRGRSLDDVKNLRYDIVRDFAMLYIKGVDGIVSKEIIEAKQRGYFDRIFIDKGKQYKFVRFGNIRYDLISIIAKRIDGEPNELAGFKIYENGYFIWFDFTEDNQAPLKIDIVKESIDSNLIEKRLVKIIEDINNTINEVPSNYFEGLAKADKALKELVIDIKKTTIQIGVNISD